MSSSQRDEILERLRRFESRNVTYLPAEASWPIVWERAKGMQVWDSEGRQYLDFTAAFGVAAAGHAAPPVVRAGRRQMGHLLHAMGDVHPHPLKATLAERLSDLTFGRWGQGSGKTVFCNSGFETIEVALKSACQATGRSHILSFEGGYHGLGYGALVATHRSHFRGEFGKQVGEFGGAVPYPSPGDDLGTLRELIVKEFEAKPIGALLVEPIQGRGGINVPPDGFLAMLRTICDEFGAVLIFDEIYTGFGRSGTWFACEDEGVFPDLICVGKALTGGFPLSALIGESEVMDQAWPKSTGEAIHTSTYLGHPVGCAMALAQIDLIERRRLVERSSRMGALLKKQLEAAFRDYADRVSIRGRGLMIGVELRTPSGAPDSERSLGLIENILTEGYLLLPDGEFGNIIGITPPLILTTRHIKGFVETLFQLYHKSLFV